MKRYIIPLIVVLFVSCSKSSTKKAEPTSDSTATATADSSATDTTATAATDTSTVDAVTSATALPKHTSFNGTLMVTPQHHATVSVTMGGKIKWTSLMPGRYIQRGSVVATLDNPAFIELQKDYMDAYSQLTYLQSEYKRQMRLSTQEAASQKKVQMSRADYLSMKVRMDASATQLANLGVSPSYIIKHGIRRYMCVYAPISGYVANLSVNVGKYVREGDPLCDVIDKSSPMVCLTAHEKDLGNVQVGNRVQFRVNGMGNQTFKAVVSTISQQVDNVNRSIEIYCKVYGNNPRFRPGMYVMAHVEKK